MTEIQQPTKILERALEILKQYFGYDELRKGQAGVLDAILGGRDCLGVMPTGAGKSVCYQVPAMLLPGVTIVVSPLISLMRDQVLSLEANGIPAAFINSSLTSARQSQALNLARKGRYKIIYIAPERLLSPSTLELARTLKISLLAVDEAHCISQWGQDFRPAYMDIPRFLELLPERPILAAFTATATPRVRQDILETLGMQNPLSLVTGFDRPNLYFEVNEAKDKFSALTEYLKIAEGCGIVYCATRKETDGVAERLAAGGFSAARYHAGLSDAERGSAQDDFLYDRVKIIVATNAFGMGIDKSNVRFVIHYNMPQSMESYYQEAGRAGRDGLRSDCVLLYARRDINTLLFLIEKSENPDEIYRNKQLLAQMERYCETEGCLRRYMLDYFGERADEDCGNCGSCCLSFEKTDVTVDAQKLLSHLTRLNKLGKYYRFPYVSKILLGKSEDFTDLSTFGIMRGVPIGYIRRLTSRLTDLGYIYDDDGRLSASPGANAVLFGGERVTMRGEKPAGKARPRRERPSVLRDRQDFSEPLFEKLRQLRLQIAREEALPAFVVFSDATLRDMCVKKPGSAEEMLTVSGVGQVKLERYGARFLELTRE